MREQLAHIDQAREETLIFIAEQHELLLLDYGLPVCQHLGARTIEI
jgi:hypothetical protein